ncbi:MAG TPA: Gldg family protein [Coleofasciculaceae cyanobacterium]
MKRLAQYLPYLFWPGAMLILAGLAAGVVAGTWVPIPLGLIVLGLAVIGVWLLWLGRSPAGAHWETGFWRRRSTRSGANALVATLSVLAILGLLNFLAARYSTRLDLTETKLFTLAPETQQLVSHLKQPVKAWVFDPQQNPQDRELLTSYQRQNPQFSYEFVDPRSQLSLAQRFGIKSMGDVYIEVPAEKRQQFVQRVTERDRLSESKLTNALEQVSRSQPVTVYVLQGHGERSLESGDRGALTEAVKALEGKNYTVKPLNLTEKSTIPTDGNVVILAGPQKALLASEVKALETYLNQGGNLLLLVDPETDPGLDPLLQSWGVRLDQRVAIDASGRLSGLGPADSIVSDYGNHPITREFGNTFSFYSFARPVAVDSMPAVQAAELLKTSDRSWAESDLKQTPLRFDAGKDQQGPLTLGFALSRPVTSDAKPGPSAPGSAPPKESRLVVIGNSSFATDGLFDQLLNGDVFLNSVRWLTQQDQQALSIRPRETKNRRFTLSPQQANLAVLTAIGLLPLLAFTGAGLLWWRRR